MSDLRLVLLPRICSMLTASSEQSAARLAGSTQLLGRENIIMLLSRVCLRVFQVLTAVRRARYGNMDTWNTCAVVDIYCFVFRSPFIMDLDISATIKDV